VFKGFETFDIKTAGAIIHGRTAGTGPGLLLLHGIPETHLMWHQVAPRLTDTFTVVATDLRGWGDSSKPPSAPDHRPYSMREIGGDQVEVMRELGFESFALAGHDRGGRCAYRMALDYPDAVDALAVLDIIPTGEAFGRADMAFSLGYWVWSFLAAPYPVPEQLIAGSPDTIVDHMLDSWTARPDTFSTEIRNAYRQQFRDPNTVHAICEEYRAAATLDVEFDNFDYGRKKIRCPVLALWAQDFSVQKWYDPLAVWSAWADDVRGQAVDCGHFIPEEASDQTVDQFRNFFTTASGAST
jgi:haloacetate dehalogenase